jgi:hypothetical protein
MFQRAGMRNLRHELILSSNEAEPLKMSKRVLYLTHLKRSFNAF